MYTIPANNEILGICRLYGKVLEMISKKKLTIPLVTVAMILPVLYVASVIPVIIDSYSLSPDLSVEDLAPEAKLIVKGKILTHRSEIQYIDDDVSKHILLTNWDLKPEKFLKGSSNENLINVKILGGKYDNNVFTWTHLLSEDGDDVILFLNLDPDSIYGDSYHVAGVISGHYKITDDGKAKNTDMRKDTTEKQLEKRIENSLSK